MLPILKSLLKPGINMNVDSINMRDDWKCALRPFLKSEKMEDIIRYINKRSREAKVIPSSDKVFNTFNICPFRDLKVVILGQDPYPNEQDACGSAFKSGSELHTPSSLRNILNEVERDTNKLLIDEDITRWEEQGVLLLNTSLTTEEKNPGAHKGVWDPFIHKVFEVINHYHSGIIFMLWGNHAKSYKPYISSHQYILESTHPSPLSFKKGNNPFDGCSHFTKANEIIRRMNGTQFEIEW